MDLLRSEWIYLFIRQRIKSNVILRRILCYDKDGQNEERKNMNKWDVVSSNVKDKEESRYGFIPGIL